MERARRLWAATEALSRGPGGIAPVARATGLAERTVRLGQPARQRPATSIDAPRRLRRPGAGRKPRPRTDQPVLQALEALVEPTTRGDPMAPLRWTGHSTRRLAKELGRQGHPGSHRTVGQLLKARHASWPGTRQTREGASPPDRNAQVEHIHARVKDVHQRGQPVVSVDTKTNERVGDLAHGGREYHPQGTPERVRGPDVLDQPLGTALPSGGSDLTHNGGWVSGGGDHATADGAVASLQPWWQRRGRRMAPQAQQGLMTAEGGGRHGRRSRLWQVALQPLSDVTGLDVHGCHFPPGTSQWHKIAPRWFGHRTDNWRGRPLVSHEVSVNLLANPTTAAGRRVEAALDPPPDETGHKGSAADLAQVTFDPADFHGHAWNDVIKPRDANP